MNAVIEKLDGLGNGICYINDKICFVPKCIPGDEVEIKITYENKDYLKAQIIRVIKPAKERIEPFCPYFNLCGGCSLQMLSYDKGLEYKKERVKNILQRVIEFPEPEVIVNPQDRNYRNKIELKIQNKAIGFYERKTHNLIPIHKCPITKDCINDFIPELKLMNLTNGDVMIRANFNDELLISITTSDEVKLNEENYPKRKVVGIIVNGKTIYGENHFIDKIGNYFFDVSYDSFFQVNSYINEKLFNLITENTLGDTLLDLYSGVGTLGIVASKTAQKVYSIECVPNAVLNGIKNAKMNTCNNINFILGNVEDKIKFIEDKVDTVIVDPPRKGLDDFTLNKLLEFKPKKIIYISCETESLANNLKVLKDLYKLDKLYILDMFSYSYLAECVCILNIKDGRCGNN